MRYSEFHDIYDLLHAGWQPGNLRDGSLEGVVGLYQEENVCQPANINLSDKGIDFGTAVGYRIPSYEKTPIRSRSVRERPFHWGLFPTSDVFSRNPSILLMRYLQRALHDTFWSDVWIRSQLLICFSLWLDRFCASVPAVTGRKPRSSLDQRMSEKTFPKFSIFDKHDLVNC